LQDDSTPPSPSTHVSDLDPAIERVILRCLERDPLDRPASALAVAAALPGGDPLAAALAAGETPSPEMVAAAGEKHGLHPGVAAAWLAVVIVGLVVNAIVTAQASTLNRTPMELPPDALAVRARDILRGLGYTEPPASSAFSFKAKWSYVHYLNKQSDDPNRMDVLREADPPVVSFWYRQSPKPLVVDNFFARSFKEDLISRTTVSWVIPAWDEPGMTGVVLNLRGKLRWFRAIPPREEEAARPASEPPWSQWFPEELVGFRLDDLEPAPASHTPPDAYHHRRAWKAKFAGIDAPVRIEAAAYAGKPVYFAVRGDWEEYKPLESNVEPLKWLFAILSILVKVTAAVLVVRNWRLQRADRRGGFRFACYVFAVYMIIWLLEASHIFGRAEVLIFEVGLAQALWQATIAWLYYMALEPYIRRLWPQTLTTTGRVLEGRLRDPVVGRDLLVGIAVSMIANFVILFQVQLPTWLGWSLVPPVNVDPHVLRGPRSVLSFFFEAQIAAVQITLFLALLLFLLRLLLRRQWLANAAFVALYTGIFVAASPFPGLTWAFAPAVLAVVVWVVTRFGLLAMIAFVFSSWLISNIPLTFEPVWYRDYGFFAMAMVLALAGYGFWTSLGGSDRAAQ
jgi:serine/threonine-protein kinase